MAKFRVRWRRYFEHYDIKGSYSDASPGLIYNQYPFHKLLNFKFSKAYSKQFLFDPKTYRFSNIHHTIKYKYIESKYNYEIVFNKIYQEYYDFDYVMTNLVIHKIQYIPLVFLFYTMKVWYRVDCYISLCKNWNEFISDSFLEFYQNHHVEFDPTRGVSYQTFFDKKIRDIFCRHYIINRDKDDSDIQTLMHRLSWLHPDELSYDENISLYSNYTSSKNLFDIYTKGMEEEIDYLLDPHLASSQDFLNKF